MTGDRAGGSFRHRPRSQSARSHRRRPVRPRPLRVSCPARTGVQPPGARAHPDRGGALRRLPEKRAGALSCDVSRTVARARQQAHPWRTPQPAQPDSRHSNGFESGANFPPPDRAHPRYADAQDATPNAVFPAEPGESRSSTACAGLRTTQRGAPRRQQTPAAFSPGVVLLTGFSVLFRAYLRAYRRVFFRSLRGLFFVGQP